VRNRDLSEVLEPERVWFQPGLDRLAALNTDPDPWIREFFSPDRAVYLGRAPGRLDVMGGIADYSGGQVMELPLDRSTLVLAQRQAAPRCELVTRRGSRWDRFGIELEPLTTGSLIDPGALRGWFASRPQDRWAAYLAGVVQACLRARDTSGPALPGFRLLVDSAVPEGKGVASSAALEVAAMAAVAASCGASMPPNRLATACQWVENHIVGAPCGIMDQMTSACGMQDRLLLLRCQPDVIEGQIQVPAGYRFYGIDSGIRHDVSAADYGTVRTAAFMGYRMVADTAGLTIRREGEEVRIDDPLWHGYLANIPLLEYQSRFETILPEKMAGGDFLARYGGTTDSATRVRPDRSYPVRNAATHPIAEQARVARFIEILGKLSDHPGLAAELGALMYASHESYGRCGLGSSGTDRLVELVAAAGPTRGLYGAKITGGGSGGTVAVFGRAGATGVVDEIAARYARETGRECEVFDRSGPGAAETGVLTLQHLRNRRLP
jgi:galactokinase